MTPRTADEYIASVVETFPRGAPLRGAVAMELRAHITERARDGRALDEVLRQLGDPATLAESYLAAIPLDAAPVSDRLIAKVIDATLAFVLLSPVLYLCAKIAPPQIPTIQVLVVVALLGGGLVLGLYTAFAEARSDQTLGKRVMGLRVVRESGARISGGQAIVRQLPIVLQVIWVDALFAFFTERSQRAFELLSKTRVVPVSDI